MINERQRDPPCVLDTANGKIVLDLEGDVVCDGILLRSCVYNPYATFSLLSISRLEQDGWTYLEGSGQCTLRKRATTKTLARSGGLYLLGAAGRSLAAVEATMEIVITADDEVSLRVPRMQPVDPAVKPLYVKDGVSLNHLQAGHKPYDPACTTCQTMKMRMHQHRRSHDEPEGGQVSVDLAGPWPEALKGEKYLLVMVRRDTRMVLCAPLPNKTSNGIKEAMTDFKFALKSVWRFHSDRGKEFMGERNHWMREHLIVHTTTPGYDSQANGIAERAIQEVTQGITFAPGRGTEVAVGRGGKAFLQHPEPVAAAFSRRQVGHPAAS